MTRWWGLSTRLLDSSRPDILAPGLLASDERFRLESITRLYLVVHGRPPDPGGLAAYMGHLRNGKPLETIAEEFVASGEFQERVKGRDARALLYHHALGPGAERSNRPVDCSLGREAAALVLSPIVQGRLAILPALYPDGVPLRPSDYRMWLQGRPRCQPAPPAVDGGAVLSLITLLDRPNLGWLAEMVGSVRRVQASLELVVAARWPVGRGIRLIVGHAPRARLVLASPWSDRSTLFNRALAWCKGPFTGLIGQHDQLDEAVAALPSASREADIVMTDDDRLNEEGLRQDPRFGTEWDPDRTIAAGFPGLLLIRTEVLRRVGGLQRAQGREEWAMLLRAAAATDAGRIVHVPAVALSRRGNRFASSTPPALVQPGPVQPAHVAAATRYLRSTGRQGSVQPQDGLLRVVYPLPAPPPLVSVIIPTRDRADLLRRCMGGLLTRTDYPALEVVIVDNGSVDDDALALLRQLAQDGRVRVLPQPGPFNWSALNNTGVGAMRGEVAVLLNNDIDVLDPSWLTELVSQAMRPEVGVVGAKLLYGDGRVQHAGVVLGPAGRSGHMWRYMPGDARGYLDQLVITRRASALTGACLAIRRGVYVASGGCEADALPVTWNDVDLCLRIKMMGLQVIWTPYARLLHLEQATRGTDDTPGNQVRFERERAWMRARWGDAIDRDPFWNPNLLPSETEMRLSLVSDEVLRC